MVIIISSTLDEHVPFVTKHFQQNYLVLDASTIIEGRGLTFAMRNGQFEVTHAGLPITDVSGVWVRKPSALGIDIELPVPENYKEYSQRAIQSQVSQMYSLWEDATWISDKYAIQRAENKMYQLKMAHKVGFKVPDTVTTSCQQDAEQFVSSHSASIVKPISHAYASAGKERHYKVFFSTKVQPGDKIDYSGLNLAPSIFQLAVEPGFDLRVTVVGKAVFAAKVTIKGAPKGRIRDWHVTDYHGSMVIEPYELSAELSNKCVRLVNELGLRFGALDFVQDNKGQVWFIEINPNGQWAWVEEQTGQPIGKAIADLLEGRA